MVYLYLRSDPGLGKAAAMESFHVLVANASLMMSLVHFL
jgi:hypothetical protein